MSGHSRWAKLKHHKGAIDAKRGKLFSKHVRAIAAAARHGGGDPDYNPRLRAAVLAAEQDNVPRDNLERAIQRGTGKLEGVEFAEVTYEGYAPGGVAVLVDVLTDNRNRTLPELRTLFERFGGNLGQDGCVSWMFERRGVAQVPKEKAAEERLLEIALEAGAEDMRDGGDTWDVYALTESFEDVVAALRRAGVEPARAEVQRVPKSQVHVEGSEAGKVLRLVEALEDHDDVQKVWANFDVPDEVLESLGG